MVFLDTETTGLHRARRPWEIAIIRRAGDEQTKLHVCVDLQDLDLDSAEPEGLAISGFHKRHPQARQRPLHIPRVYRAADAALMIQQWTADATIVGVVPRFDTECVTEMLARHGLSPHWRSDVTDVVPLAVAAVQAFGLQPEPHYEDLSRQCGVKPPGLGERHTAVGDARWAMRWYDKLVQSSGSGD
ncbi:MAG TPA: exonuclease domain-containing protein, partial [Mycobacterium sp.]|nr:exonuclease domain-containing protein [Mycobacterium sp.]